MRARRAARIVFTAPRLRTLDAAEATRRATWLELFYDLVYVVVVAALAHELVGNVSLAGLLTFVALFVPVWWSWVGVTLYNDRFDTDDLGHRLYTLLAMLGAASLALSVHGALTGPVFVLSYVFLRALLILQYLRVARHVPLARSLCLHYAVGFGLAAALWVGSLALDAPWRYVAWGVAMVVDIGTPLTARHHQAKLPLSTSHLPERIGLFTIIVLGESVAAVVRGIETPRLDAFIGGALALVIAFALWWVYFEHVDEHVVRRTRIAGQVWFYAHLPLAMGIVLTAVGVEGLVGVAPGEPIDAATRWLVAGGFALCLGALAAIHVSTTERSGPPLFRRRALVRSASALAAVALALAPLPWPAAGFGLALGLLGVAQVALEPSRGAPQAAS